MRKRGETSSGAARAIVSRNPTRFPACARDSQSLDAGDDGVEGGLHVGGGAGGHDGLGLFVEQLGHVLRRETGEWSELMDRVTHDSSFPHSNRKETTRLL